MNFTGYTPYAHQKAVHEAMGIKGQEDSYFRSGRMFVIKSKRQVGKTTMAENILLHCALNHRGTLSVLVEPTLDQARRVYKEIVKAVEGTPAIARKNDSLLEIEFGNGSSILFKSAEQHDNLRGFTVTGILVIDECAFIQDDVFDILMPTTDVHAAPIILISTPKLKVGAYYRYYMAGLDPVNTNITSIDFNAFDTSFMLPPERLEQYRRMMPKSQFTTEYLGEFLDSDSILFTGIRDCIGPAPTEFRKVSVGIDWGTGTGGDYTSVAAFTDERRMLFIDYFNDRSTFDQVKYICSLLEPYEKQVDCILAESNSIGSPMIDLLKEELVRRGRMHLHNAVTPFNTTNREKARLVNQLQVGLEQRDVTLLDDPNLLNQLFAYEATYNPRTGVVSYNAPAGLHDDNCISTMLALDAASHIGRHQTGMYAISSIRRFK